MPSFNDYLYALRAAVSDERYPFALEQLGTARRFLTENRRRELEFAKDAAARLGMLDAWFGGFLAKEVKNTLALLAEERNLDELDDISIEESEETVTVTTARPLDQPLKKLLLREFGAARATFKTDASLIGGVKIRVGDREVDNSLRARLQRIAG